ncbi:MAG TPA: hypothetical protein VI408_09175 [Gaiellaceae bacterium]
MSLSVCILSGGDPRRLAALLGAVRGVADETVVAVDERVDPERLEAVSSLADVLVRYPFAPPVERPLAWLHSLTTREWVFRIDDDEAPSAALLELLAAPPSHLTHVYVPRRWLWREGWIDADPWAPDWQLRLTRRDAARFPGVMHIPIAADGPHAYLDAPLYHLDLVLNDYAARAAKARRYDAERPGLRLGGTPLNEAYYLPEDRDPATVDIPAGDVATVRAVFRPAEIGAGALSPRLATREEVDAYWSRAPLPSYAARLELGRPPRFVEGEVRQVDVVVHNDGATTWPATGYPEIRVAYDGGLRTALPHDVAPGESVVVPASVRAPEDAGDHIIQLDLVHEGVRWFGAAADLEISVARRLVAVVLVGQPPGDEPFDRAVDAVLAALPRDAAPFLVGPRPSWLRDRFNVDAASTPPQAYDLVRVVPAGNRRNRLRLWREARTLRRNARR